VSNEVNWLDNWQQALDRAEDQKKNVFLDFFSPT